MHCGISTACFYPQDTLLSLQQVAQAGATETELFFNTFSELEEPYLAQIEGFIKQSGIKVLSVHPFSSAMETFFFASTYATRFSDGVALYRKFFAACERFGAKILVFHGDYATNPGNISDEEYASTFCKLAKIGREYGVTLCHENVYYCRLNSPKRVEELRVLLGEYAAFVLDTKQALRSGYSVLEMLQAMGSDMIHLHLSDYTQQADCLPPGQGTLDINGLLCCLRNLPYQGDIVIELYRSGFKTAADLTQAMQHVNALIKHL